MNQFPDLAGGRRMRKKRQLGMLMAAARILALPVGMLAGTAGAVAQDADELAKRLSNPVAAMISVP
nr:hypothetical protein [Mesorhizobium sp. ZC-5]